MPTLQVGIPTFIVGTCTARSTAAKDFLIELPSVS
jgi:hypothetical protein